jgi:hypothetical protein
MVTIAVLHAQMGFQPPRGWRDQLQVRFGHAFRHSHGGVAAVLGRLD